ncbi:MAG: penicillin acylase family protein, partial [Oceanicaulis sp.]
DVFHAASFRAIYDLADLNRSRFMFAPGQSGHPLSPHHGDLAARWAAGEYFEIRDDWGPEATPQGARTLTLRGG